MTCNGLLLCRSKESEYDMAELTEALLLIKVSGRGQYIHVYVQSFTLSPLSALASPCVPLLPLKCQTRPPHRRGGLRRRWTS